MTTTNTTTKKETNSEFVREMNRERMLASIRKKKFDAQPKDEILAKCKPGKEYEIEGYIDFFKYDYRHGVKILIVSMNTIKIKIAGKVYYLDHVHLHSDDIDGLRGRHYTIGQTLKLTVKVISYNNNKKKFNFTNK